MKNWKLRHTALALPPGGVIMGILNVTPDSFSDGGSHTTPPQALAHAELMLEQGATIIDVGGESTRPGAQEVSVQEELRRVLPVLRLLRSELPDAILSVDTRHAAVARTALEAGVDIVNDICGLSDPAMREVCAEYACGVVIMHMQGEPATMQLNPSYRDVISEVRDFLDRQVQLACAAGINMDCICLDPGIGFGKTSQQNLQLIDGMELLRVHDLPILIGLSRKRFLKDVLPGDEQATVKMSLRAAEHGAQVHRVHEVAPLFAALKKSFL